MARSIAADRRPDIGFLMVEKYMFQARASVQARIHLVFLNLNLKSKSLDRSPEDCRSRLDLLSTLTHFHSMGLYLLDYGAGNVQSLANSITALGHNFTWITSREDFKHATVSPSRLVHCVCSILPVTHLPRSWGFRNCHPKS